MSGLYYKLITIINGNCRVVNKLEASLIDDFRVIINDRHMFIVQATEEVFVKSFGQLTLFCSFALGLHFRIEMSRDAVKKQSALDQGILKGEVSLYR